MTFYESIAEEAGREVTRRAKARQYVNDPVLWAKDYLGVKLWSRQGEIAMSIVKDKNTVVKAAHEVGKSWLAGLIICWWVDTHWQLPGGCFVVSTAPSTAQINAIVWREVRQFFATAQSRFDRGLVDHVLPGYITADAHWRLSSGIELGYGRKPPTGSDDTMSGIHARYVLAIGDEAVGLSKELIGDLANITSNATSRRLLILNPTNPLSYVASIFQKKLATWGRHTLSVWDSPNFTGEEMPVEALESLVDQSYVDGIIDEHGKDSPTYISRVDGEFAWDMGFTLVKPEDVAVGLDVEITPDIESLPVLGVDFSRSKRGDKNTVYLWHDGKIRYVDEWNEPNAVKTAERVDKLAREYGVWVVQGDGVGLGGPILDQIADLSEGKYEVVALLGNDASPNIQRWANARAYWYWSFQDRLSKGQIDMDVADEKLQQQLLGIELKQRVSGRDNIQIESKKDMADRGIHSPDHADAAIYASVDYYSLFPEESKPGDIVIHDPSTWEMDWDLNGAGMPM